METQQIVLETLRSVVKLILRIGIALLMKAAPIYRTACLLTPRADITQSAAAN